MKKILVIAVSIVMVLPALVSAVIIDFEDLYPGYEADELQLPEGYAGFNWSDSAKVITSLYHPGSGYEYGAIGRVCLYTSSARPISMSGEQFQLSGAYVASAWNDTQDFAVEGWLNGSQVYSQIFTTTNTELHWFDFNQQVVDTVWFMRVTGSQIVIDNITILVPEPGTMFLFGLGGLVLRRRK